jgi:cytochrome c-type biogenesis protein CcmH/NrfG
MVYGRYMLFIIVFSVLMVGMPTAQAQKDWQPKISVQEGEAIGVADRLKQKKIRLRFNKLFFKGRRLLSQGSYQRARRAFSKAVELLPEHAGARIGYARTLLTIGYLTWNREMIYESAVNINKAKQLSPDDIEVAHIVELLDGLKRRMRKPAKVFKRKKRN